MSEKSRNAVHAMLSTAAARSFGEPVGTGADDRPALRRSRIRLWPFAALLDPLKHAPGLFAQVPASGARHSPIPKRDRRRARDCDSSRSIGLRIARHAPRESIGQALREREGQYADRIRAAEPGAEHRRHGAQDIRVRIELSPSSASWFRHEGAAARRAIRLLPARGATASRMARNFASVRNMSWSAASVHADGAGLVQRAQMLRQPSPEPRRAPALPSHPCSCQSAAVGLEERPVKSLRRQFARQLGARQRRTTHRAAPDRSAAWRSSRPAPWLPQRRLRDGVRWHAAPPCRGRAADASPPIQSRAPTHGPRKSASVPSPRSRDRPAPGHWPCAASG